MSQPIYLGENQLVAFLPTGEPVVVDGRSDDSFNLLLGWGIEQDVLPVFRSLLKADTHFIDIGANFGVYSAVAASICTKGSILSIEANPWTFKLLQRTMYCNRVRHNPSMRQINAAAADKSGETVRLKIQPNALGGSSIWVPEKPHHEIAEIKTVSIDDLVGKQPIDVVKIDVEGYEPLVLRGMRKTIANSPNIHIIMEYFTGMIEGTVGSVAQFQKEIADTGLRMFKFCPNSRLEEVDLATPLDGNHYVLLTRDPSRAMSRTTEIEAGTMFINPQYPNLPSRMNPISVTGDQLVPGRHIFYGPYMPVAPGLYDVTFDGELDGELEIRFAHKFGHTLSQAVVSSFDKPVQLALKDYHTQFEIIGAPKAGLKKLLLRKISLTRR